MKMDMLDIAVVLADGDLLARLPVLAAHERTATAELVAHLAALRLRPSLYAAHGYGSLFAYCRHALRLSEDTAANRVHAARACLKYPVILDLLASGELSLSAVRMLRRHHTMDNHECVLARARNARKEDIERLIAELAPRPAVPSSVRKLPLPRASDPPPSAVEQPSQPVLPQAVTGTSDSKSAIGPFAAPVATSSMPRPVVRPLSPERYRVQFTIGQDAHDILRRLQTLLRREIPDGDAGVIIERALRLLHQEVEAAKFGKPTKGRKTARKRYERPPMRQDNTASDQNAAWNNQANAPEASGRVEQEAPVTAATPGAYENRIRPGADPTDLSSATGSTRRAMDTPEAMRTGAHSRYISKSVKRAVWYRDRGQCAFVSASGQRCFEQEFLELHHIQPYALNGPATVANIALRCRRHNAYEAEVIFGARAVPPMRRERTSRAAG